MFALCCTLPSYIKLIITHGQQVVLKTEKELKYAPFCMTHGLLLSTRADAALKEQIKSVRRLA